MNPEEKNPKMYKDEINLYDLWENILKRKKLVLGLFIISVISAGMISFTMPKIYRGEVTVRIQLKELISAKELFEIIGKFDREKMEIIFPRESDSIKEVMITQISGSTDKFKITVELSQIAHFQGAINAFLQYMNSIPLITRTVDQHREQLLKRLEEIDIVMKKSQQDANSFQKMMIKEKLNPVGFNPVQFNKMLSDLEVEKIYLQQNVKTLTGVEIVTAPTISPKAVKPRPMLYITIAAVTSLIFGTFLAIFLMYLGNIKR